MADLIETLVKELLERAAPELADRVVREVTTRLKTDTEFCYTEKEAAEKLKISPDTLAEIRRNKLIEFSYSLVPAMSEGGHLRGGRVTYKPEHIEDYLKRNEQKRHFGKLKAA